MGNDKLYFKNLDSIRFIAALMVFMGHALTPSYLLLPIQDTIWEHLLYTISDGVTGVSIFFVLSGFLITYLLISEYELNSKIALKNFYIRRVLRIWPLYYLVVVFSFIIYPFLKSLFGIESPLGGNLWYHLMFLSNFDVLNIEKICFGCTAMSQNITWSVSIEEQFYLFWPLIFFLLPKRMWFIAIGTVIIVSIIFRLLNNSDIFILYFHTLSVLLDLGIGGMFALLIKSNKTIRNFFENCSTFTHISLFTFSICLLLCNDMLETLKYGPALSRVGTSFSFALIISAQAITKKDTVLNLGKITFANTWGKYTYGIYLLHPIAILMVDITSRVTSLPKTNFVTVFSMGIVSFIITLILSKISYTYYESKFLALKKKFTTIQTQE